MAPSSSEKSKKERKERIDRKNTVKSKEKIFVDIYSSYLKANRTGSPEQRDFSADDIAIIEGDEAGEGERELTPMMRQVYNPNRSFDMMKNNVMDTHMSAKKLGSS